MLAETIKWANKVGNGDYIDFIRQSQNKKQQNKNQVKKKKGSKEEEM